MVERPSEIRSSLPCPLCGRSLLPVTSEASFTFHCKTGHELTLQDLLAAQSMVLRMGLETLLLEWHRQHRTLLEIAEDARKNGFLDVVEIFQRRAAQFERRMEVLRNAFTRREVPQRL
jgi:hypothetical protein